MKNNMYTTVRRYEGVPDSSVAARQVDEIFVPLISSLPGFVEYYWINLGNGSMISITVFETLSDAIDANHQATKWVKELLGHVLPPSVRTEAGAIVAYKGR